MAVVEKVVGYKKIKFYTHENAGYGDVRLPEMQMHTTAFWLTVPEALVRARAGGPRGGHRRSARHRAGPRDGGDAGAHVRSARSGHHAGRHGAGGRRRDGRDLGVARTQCPAGYAVDPQPGFNPTLFVYEHVPGGTGLAERIWEQRDELLARALRLIERCPCRGRLPGVRRARRVHAQGHGDRATALDCPDRLKRHAALRNPRSRPPRPCGHCAAPPFEYP